MSRKEQRRVDVHLIYLVESLIRHQGPDVSASGITLAIPASIYQYAQDVSTLVRFDGVSMERSWYAISLYVIHHIISGSAID
jgi:hypothetical protein